MVISKDFWRNKKVLITGHTGFKGSWLTVMLSQLGSEVYGISLKEEFISLAKDISIENRKEMERKHEHALYPAKQGGRIEIHPGSRLSSMPKLRYMQGPD